MSYADFLRGKQRMFTGEPVPAAEQPLPNGLHDWQARMVRWALKKGRAALFADTGLGKTRMQLAWANAQPGRTLILAPLCVADQTVAEGRRMGIASHYAQAQADVAEHRIVVTNYERLEKFDAAAFSSVVLDESSILKAFDGQTRTTLIRTFADTPYRLCCTATPSPNDITELANHAEFLGLMTRAEFLATWFVRVDAGKRTLAHHGWRMKRHAVAPFYRWMASWALAVRHPRDLGAETPGYDLPPLRIHDVVIDAQTSEGVLFPELSVYGIQGRLAARRGALGDRVAAVSALVQSMPGPWLLWCGLNEEAEAITAALPGAVNVQGSDSYAEKVGAVRAFQAGTLSTIVSKPKILGFGMNFQHCAQMVFVGLGDSYETYYQAIRRCYRYGQTRPVDVYVVVSEAETVVVRNVREKERRAADLSAQLMAHLGDECRKELAA